MDEREIREILCLGDGQTLPIDTAVNKINKRQDYVQQNITILERQLESAEAQLERLLDDIPTDPGTSGLPLTEILEELDDDDNVVSSNVSQPEQATANILETLRKAGITELDPAKSKSGASQSAPSQTQQEGELPADQPSTEESKTQESVQSSANASVVDALKDAPEPPKTRKKSVSFSEDTKSAPAISAAQNHSLRRESNAVTEDVGVTEAVRERKKSVSFADVPDVVQLPPQPAPEAQIPVKAVNPELTRGSFGDGERVIELDEDDDMVGATIPTDESPEDARLRREMLQYSLNEVGSVVAELELDDNWSDDDDDDLELDDADFPTDSDVEEEDEHGRTKGKVMSDDYRKQMLELQEKLGANLIGNLGPDGAAPESGEINPDELRRLVVRPDSSFDAARETPEQTPAPQPAKEADGAKGTEPKAKKSVSFADVLDVAPKPSPQQPKSESTAKPAVVPAASSPLSDVVLERSALVAAPSSTDASSKPKVSRFKQRAMQSQAAEPEPQPQPQSQSQPLAKSTADALLADRVLERPSTQPTGAPEETDEYDPELQQRQLATEYYRMRNNMIRQQGGFKPTEEEIDQPLMEEDEEGKVKRVSRFKAARLRP